MYLHTCMYLPLHLSAFAPFASELDGDMLMTRDHVPVKMAMKKEQVRERL